MKYCSGYGTKFRQLPMLQNVNETSVFTWTLFMFLSGCPYLWYVVDTKETRSKLNGWELWVLTTIQSILFYLDSIQVNSHFPFKKLATLNAIVSKVK